jgi:hypothetical protein
MVEATEEGIEGAIEGGVIVGKGVPCCMPGIN